MVVDTSALLAILFNETERAAFITALAQAPAVYISTGTRVEASIVALGKSEAVDAQLALLVETIGAVLVPVDEPQSDLARNAIKTYGKGRHPARLNLGDSFAYALAMHLGEPLLFKGNDFVRTDVRCAL